MKRTVTLLNGLRVFLDSRESLSDVGIAIAIASGSRYENIKELGISHLLEHLIVSGSTAYKDNIELAQKLDSVSLGNFNGHTSQEAMIFCVSSKRSDSLACLELIANLVLRPRINKGSLAKQIQRIQEEEYLDEDDVSGWIQFLVEELVFKGNSLSNPVSFSQFDPSNINVKTLRAWHRKIVRGKRIVISVVGNFDSDKILEKIRKLFEKLPSGKFPKPEAFKTTQKRLRLKLVKKETKAVHIAIAFPTFGFSDPQRIALSVLNNHLGSTNRSSSRLEIKLNSVYWIKSEVWHFSDSGRLVIFTGVKPEVLTDVLKTINDELQTLRLKKISGDNLWLAKKSLKNNARERKYNTGDEASFYAVQILETNQAITADQFIRAVNKIKAIDVLRVAKKIIRPGKMNALMAGPIDSLDRKQITAVLRFPNKKR